MKSEGYKKYLLKEKINKCLVLLSQLSILILLIIIWQLLADYNLINTFITSSPKNILDTIINLYQTNNLIHHILITTYETIISFSIGTILGIIIAIILWYSKFIYKVIDPYLTILNSLPKVSLGPILIIWVGANIKSIIVMSLLISIIITIITVYNGFNSTDNNKIKLLAQIFSAIGLDDYSIVDKVWKIYCDDQENEYLGDDVFRLADKYMLLSAKEFTNDEGVAVNYLVKK